MRHGALFNGIGGFQLAAEWMGWENVFHCEIDQFCNKVVKKHFPKSICHGDIRETDFTKYRGAVDILTGGFPCQNISIVGKGQGITGEKSGLWMQAYRAIDEIRPSYVVLENSCELLKKGFENILYPFSEIGYDVEWECFQANQFGFPHKRERLFILAYSNGIGRESDNEKCGILSKISKRGKIQNPAPSVFLSLSRPDSSGNFEGLQLDNGFSRELDKNSIRAFGNAIVPEIALEIFKAINKFLYEQLPINKTRNIRG